MHAAASVLGVFRRLAQRRGLGPDEGDAVACVSSRLSVKKSDLARARCSPPDSCSRDVVVVPEDDDDVC